MSEEMTVQRTPEIVATEIRGYTASMLTSIIEIGRRLKEVKEMLPHGEFMPWVERNTGYKQSTANNFMRLFEEYGDRQGNLFGAELANSQTFGNLTYSKALALLSIPDAAERKEFVEAHAVEDMTTKELQAAIRERDEARKQADEAAADAEQARMSAEASKKLLDQAKAQIKELESRPVEVAVQEPDEAEVEKRAAEIADKAIAKAAKASERRITELEDKLAKAEDKAKKAKDKLKTADEDAAKKSASELDAAKKAEADARAEADRLRAELDAARTDAKKAAITGDAELAQFQLLFEDTQATVNKMRGILLKVRGREDGQLGEKLTAALVALAEKVKEATA